MKRRTSNLIFIPLLGMVLTGCTQSTPSGGTTYKSIAVYKNPTKTEYTVGEYFNPVGLELNAVTSDDVTLTVKYAENMDKFTFSPSLTTPLEVTHTSVTVTFESLSTTVNITVHNPDMTLEQFNTNIKNPLITNHNYSAHIKTMLEGDTNPFVDYNFYNINDNAIYDDEEPYFYNGYIKQAGQGIVDFQMLATGQEVFPNEFYATRTDLGMSDFYEACPENAFDGVTFTKSTTERNTFVSTNEYSMAVIANLGLGLYTQLAMNPTDFKVVVAEDYSTASIKATYVISYVDPDEGSMDDSFRQVNAYVDITFSSIGNTHNTGIENYIVNPSTIYAAMTNWVEGEVDGFIKSYYNNQLPPFVTGLSYAVELKEGRVGNVKAATICDYASGDLSSSYGRTLETAGYTKVSNTEYVKEEIDEENELKKSYRVVMSYASATDRMEDGTPYGFYYPNGFFKVSFAYSTTPTGTIDTVAALKAFFSNKDIGDLINLAGLNDTYKVTNFKDGTEEANKGYAEPVYKFVAPSTASSGFIISIPDFAKAKEFIKNQRAIYDEFIGDGGQNLTFQKSGGFGTSSYSTEDAYTQIRLSYFDEMSESSYNGKVQIGYMVSNAFFDANFTGEGPETRVLENITLSGYRSQYYLGETYSFDGTVTAHYKGGKTKVVEPTTVSNPDMSTTGDKEITVTYNEGGVTATAKYTINVAEKTADQYTISTVNCTGAVINVTMPVSKVAKEGDTVTFKVSVESGYTLSSVTATYSGGSIDIAGPNTTGTYSFTMPKGDVTITVKVNEPSASHTISYSVVDESGNALVYSEVVDSSSIAPKSANEGDTVRISITATSDYTIKGIKVGSGDKVATSSISFVMGSTNINVIIYAEKTGGEGDTGIEGTYSITIPMSNPEYYNRYSIVLGANGEGKYVRTTVNAQGTTVKEMSFTYTVSGTKLTCTYKSGEFTDFQSGYRLFPDSSTTINNTGVIGDGTITILLCKSNGDTTEYTFNKQ